MLGTFSPIGKRLPEIAQRLTSYGITGDEFAEYCRIQDSTGNIFDLSRKVNFAALTSDGSTVQIVKSNPTGGHSQHTWLKRDVQNTSPEEETTAIMGAAFAFRFQLQKESILDGETRLIRNANWCCVTSDDPAQPFELTQAWEQQNYSPERSRRSAIPRYNDEPGNNNRRRCAAYG